MKRLFQLMADKKASDIFLSIGAPINIKINGVAMPVNQTVLTASAVQSLLYEVLNEHQVREFEEELELNTAYTLEGVGTYRISAFRQKGTPAVVVRYIPGPRYGFKMILLITDYDVNKAFASGYLISYYS